MVKALMLGSDMNVYYMARCYHEFYGVNANVLGKEPIRFTCYSSILNISYNENLKNPDMFADILIDYYKKHFDSILAFFGDHRLYVLQPDGSVIEFHGELEDMPF